LGQLVGAVDTVQLKTATVRHQKLVSMGKTTAFLSKIHDMKLTILFYTGLIINALLILFATYNIWMTLQSVPSKDLNMRYIMLAPVAMLLALGLSIWLRSMGKQVLAIVLLWITALPTLLSVLMWVGLAVIFILFSPSK
jgi:uncharacterized integral membrane protein